MQFTGGDPDFRPEAVAVAVGKAGGAIAVNAGAVHHLQEVFRRLVIFGQNGIRVMGAVRIDMEDCLLDTGNQLDREDPVVILRRKVGILHDGREIVLIFLRQTAGTCNRFFL